MPFEVRWLVENRVILIRSWGQMTLENLQGVNTAVQHLLETGRTPVYVISDEDWAVLDEMPIELKTLVQTLTFFSHPKVAWTFAYSAKISPLAKFLTHAVTQYHHGNYRRFADRAATLEFLTSLEPDFQIPVSAFVTTEE